MSLSRWSLAFCLNLFSLFWRLRSLARRRSSWSFARILSSNFLSFRSFSLMISSALFLVSWIFFNNLFSSFYNIVILFDNKFASFFIALYVTFAFKSLLLVASDIWDYVWLRLPDGLSEWVSIEGWSSIIADLFMFFLESFLPFELACPYAEAASLDLALVTALA